MESENVGLVVGVGTSAMSIAVGSALRLQAAVTFTFNSPPGVLSRRKHFFSEVEPSFDTVRPNQVVLLVDDIISVGVGTQTVIERLVEASQGSISLSQIVHYTIFELSPNRLGGAQLNTAVRLPIRAYRSLVRIEDALTYPSIEHCQLCAEGEPFQSESSVRRTDR